MTSQERQSESVLGTPSTSRGSGPNIQSIPPKSDIARQIRQSFLESEQAPKMVAVDFYEIESRIMAMTMDEEDDKG